MIWYIFWDDGAQSDKLSEIKPPLKCKRASEKLRIRDEIDILQDLNHENVIKMISAYEDHDNFIQVLEYLR